MLISAKTDYAVRALLILAAHEPEMVTVGTVADEQDMPHVFVRTIINDLRRAELVRSLRGQNGGYCLARAPAEITIGDVFRAMEGPLVDVHGLHPEETTYFGAAAHLTNVWIAMQESLQRVLDKTTLAHVLAGSPSLS